MRIIAFVGLLIMKYILEHWFIINIGKRKERPKAEWKRIKNTHPAIIDEKRGQRSMKLLIHTRFQLQEVGIKSIQQLNSFLWKLWEKCKRDTNGTYRQNVHQDLSIL